MPPACSSVDAYCDPLVVLGCAYDCCTRAREERSDVQSPVVAELAQPPLPCLPHLCHFSGGGILGGQDEPLHPGATQASHPRIPTSPAPTGDHLLPQDLCHASPTSAMPRFL